MSVILGLNTDHSDTSACLLIDGKLVGAVSEERLGERIKSTSAFPAVSIRELCIRNNIDLTDISHISVSRNPRINFYQRVKYGLLGGGSTSYKALLPYVKKYAGVRATSLAAAVSHAMEQDSKDFRGSVELIEHHLCHISSSYYLSNFDSNTLGFSYDASGDFVSLMLADCDGCVIEPYKRVFLPHSLGFFYSAICQHLGFTDFGEEYKVMGLSAYGEPKYINLMQNLLSFNQRDFYRLNRRYFRMHNGQASGATDGRGRVIVNRLFTSAADALLGPARLRGTELTQYHMDLAASAQEHFTNVVLSLLNHVCRDRAYENLAMAGGCALNGLTNAAIREKTPLINQFIHPAASDDGTAVGAALWTLHNVVKSEKRHKLESPFLGFSYDSNSLISCVSRNERYSVDLLSQDELLSVVARVISEGAVVGWFQGRSEWGPRALGNRSILANPCIKDMKKIINQKIKKREGFRPFAPSVTEECFATYFEGTSVSPFMQHIVPIRSEWAGMFPAITHVDNTARVQTVTKSFNPLYYSLIQRLALHTGHPLILNTSFNENEPIVETPEQAFECFARTDMDYLVVNQHLILKK